MGRVERQSCLEQLTDAEAQTGDTFISQIMSHCPYLLYVKCLHSRVIKF